MGQLHDGYGLLWMVLGFLLVTLGFCKTLDCMIWMIVGATAISDLVCFLTGINHARGNVETVPQVSAIEAVNLPKTRTTELEAPVQEKARNPLDTVDGEVCSLSITYVFTTET